MGAKVSLHSFSEQWFFGTHLTSWDLLIIIIPAKKARP
jgi:hypothetical protein